MSKHSDRSKELAKRMYDLGLTIEDLCPHLTFYEIYKMPVEQWLNEVEKFLNSYDPRRNQQKDN